MISNFHGKIETAHQLEVTEECFQFGVTILKDFLVCHHFWGFNREREVIRHLPLPACNRCSARDGVESAVNLHTIIDRTVVNETSVSKQFGRVKVARPLL